MRPQTRKPTGIGIKIDQALRDAGMTATQLAEACGVTKQSVYGWITTGRVGKDKLPLLATFFGRPLSWWLDGDDEAMLSPEERELIDVYRTLDKDLQDRVRAEARFLRDIQHKQPSIPLKAAPPAKK